MSTQLKPINVADFDELHKLIGLALWHCQAFEDTLTRFITLILKLPPSRAEAEVNEILEKMRSKTLGALIVELRKGNSTTSVSQFEKRVNQYLQERNWLVHSSWRQHHADLYTPSRLPPLFQRLTNFADESLSLQQYFGKLTRRWTLHQPGVTQEKLDRLTAQVLQRDGMAQ